MRNYHTQIDKTMFDFERYYLKVANMIPNECRVVEVGVANGASAIFLAEEILNIGKSIERFVLVDNLAYGSHNQAQTIINHIIQSGVKEFEFIQQGSLDASCTFPDGYLDICFIDASHTYEGTKADIRLWWHKIKDGGILSGHDATMEGVREAIAEVLPEGSFKIYETSKGYGVWEIIKNPEIKLK